MKQNLFLPELIFTEFICEKMITGLVVYMLGTV